MANRRIYDGTDYTFWSPDGQRIFKYSLTLGYDQNLQPTFIATRKETQIYFAGKLIGAASPGAVSPVTFEAVVTDRLGSVRVRGSQSMRYFPYGQEITATANGQDKFGTYLRDASTGLDYADQRYYSPGFGKFLTADPYIASGGAGEPGSWNLYAYVEGIQ